MYSGREGAPPAAAPLPAAWHLTARPALLIDDKENLEHQRDCERGYGSEVPRGQTGEAAGLTRQFGRREAANATGGAPAATAIVSAVAIVPLQ